MSEVMNDVASSENTDQVLVIQALNVSKSFEDAGAVIDVLRGINLSIHQADFISILGASGSGKTTLLHILGGLDTPTGGKVKLKGHDYSTLKSDVRSKWRGQHIGFIYQLHHLLPEFTAMENVGMPLLLQGIPSTEVKDKARQLLVEVGLAAREKHRPSELSGGERQRVAIARALVTQPSCVLADEPTGNLDEETAMKTQELMFRLNEEKGVSFVVVTHDKGFASKAKRVYTMHSGQLTIGG